MFRYRTSQYKNKISVYQNLKQLENISFRISEIPQLYTVIKRAQNFVDYKMLKTKMLHQLLKNIFELKKMFNESCDRACRRLHFSLGILSIPIIKLTIENLLQTTHQSKIYPKIIFISNWKSLKLKACRMHGLHRALLKKLIISILINYLCHEHCFKDNCSWFLASSWRRSFFCAPLLFVASLAHLLAI